LTATGECAACLVRLGFDETAEEAASSVFGDYEIARREDGSLWELGRGAMGVTYRAQDKVLNRAVALKVVETGQAARNNKAVRERFLREARAAAAFRHPNVASVFHFGASAEGDHCYYAMELVAGETLEALVRRDGPLPVEAALEMAAQISRALIAAAANNLIHRDLKPGNIMLTRSADAAAGLEVKVIDFGLAKATAESGNEMDLTQGAFLGTPAFASPEQFRGAPADARGDIYSLGATLWYALTGAVPYEGRTIDEIRRRQSELPLPIDKLVAHKIPKPVIRLLCRILAIDPGVRPASARELMEAVEACRAHLGHTRSNEWKTRPNYRNLVALTALLALGAAAFFAFRLLDSRPTAPKSPSSKSIAVLPFQNLSREEENAFFANGVQDEILADLAKVADLKVISRTSVMQYKSGAPRNLRQIAQELDVAHVLEGSVQRINNRVRVTVQLIDARTDRHLWADHYDRDLADVFAIQTEIARTIADQLQARISPREKAAMAEVPTTDLEANRLYLRAKELADDIAAFADPSGKENMLEAVRLLGEAGRRDPHFVRAFCQLSAVHIHLYSTGVDHTPARLELANAALQKAIQLQPDAAEVHFAVSTYAYACRDYDRARAELDLSRDGLPNNAQVYAWMSGFDRRQGRWAEAIQNHGRAIQLDPRNPSFLREAGITFEALYRYSEARRLYERWAALTPHSYFSRIRIARLAVLERADLRTLRTELSAILNEDAGAAGKIVDQLFWCALFERDSSATARALVFIPAEGLKGRGNFFLPRDWYVGLAARTFGETAAARNAFAMARETQENALRDEPEYASGWSVLGLIDAALGHKEQALREGRRACDLVPLTKDAFNAMAHLLNLAVIYAWTGERDLAIQQLATVAQTPNGPTYGDLKLNPEWDPLRGDPGFEKIVASLAPRDDPAAPK
jgi:serine/threonine-protein kinase